MNRKIAKATTLHIDIVNGTNNFTHQLTQDFVFGILTVLNTNKEFNITLNGSEILFEDLLPNYTRQPYNEEFTATSPQGTIYFDNPEVIQGVITACQWTKTDPHTVITNLIGIVDDEQTLLTF